MTTQTLPYGVTPLRERLNLRVIFFIAIFAVLLGWPLYLYLDATLSHGMKNRGDYFEVDLKAMSDFRFDQDQGTNDDVPKQWRDLNGKVVVMEGEIAPTGMTSSKLGQQFDLVYSVQKCCFSGPPQVQHFVKVVLPLNASYDVQTSGTVRVKGKLLVKVTRNAETGKIDSVYHVIADGVSSV